MSQCPWSIRWGTSAQTTTRCDKPEHADLEHQGDGPIPGQRITWYAGDGRAYTGEWPGYCQQLAPPTFNGGCVLPLGHDGRCAP